MAGRRLRCGHCRCRPSGRIRKWPQEVNEIEAIIVCIRTIVPDHSHSTNGTNGINYIAFKAKAGPINWSKSNLPTRGLVTSDPAANPTADPSLDLLTPQRGSVDEETPVDVHYFCGDE